MSGRRSARSARSAVVVLAVAILAGTGLSGCIGSTPSYTFRGIFASGQNLFPGSPVQILGLGQGSVLSVTPRGQNVLVSMSLPSSDPVPADVRAAIVAPQLLGERSVDLVPGYTGGPRLAPGTVIPESRTAVPVETNTILQEVTRYLRALSPTNVHNAVANLAQDLDGQGQALGQLITNAAGTIQLLAQKGNQLGQLNGTLARLTGALDSRTTQIETLISDYDAVSGVVAADQSQLNRAISALSTATTELAGVLSPNVSNLKADLNTLTTVGQTIDRNLASVDLGLSSSVALFAGAQRAYDPTNRWLALNNQSPPGLSSGLLADDVADRLAGICRRLLAHHNLGLSTAEISTLQTCGNPSSGFFDRVLGLVPSALGPRAQQSPSATTESVFTRALDSIPGLSAAQRRAVAAVPDGPTPAAPTSPAAASASWSTSLSPARQVGPLAPPPPVGHRGLLGDLAHPFVALAHFVGRLW